MRPSGDKVWNCISTSVLCLTARSGNDIQDDWVPLKNGSLMARAMGTKQHVWFVSIILNEYIRHEAIWFYINLC